MGFYITYVVNGDDAVGTSAVAVVGDSWKSVAESIIVDFGIALADYDGFWIIL